MCIFFPRKGYGGACICMCWIVRFISFINSHTFTHMECFFFPKTECEFFFQRWSVHFFFRISYGGSCFCRCWLVRFIPFMNSHTFIHIECALFFPKTRNVHIFSPKSIWRGVYLYRLISQIHFIPQLTYIHRYGVCIFWEGSMWFIEFVSFIDWYTFICDWSKSFHLLIDIHSYVIDQIHRYGVCIFGEGSMWSTKFHLLIDIQSYAISRNHFIYWWIYIHMFLIKFIGMECAFSGKPMARW